MRRQPHALRWAMVTAAITNQAVEEMGLRKGMSAYAVVKTSDVMIAIDD